MVNSKGKLRGDTPPNHVRIMWTTGLVKPDDKWMMVTMHAWVMALVTIIHLSAALNHWVGPPTVAPKGCIVKLSSICSPSQI